MVVFAFLTVLATQLKLTAHNHFGFWSAVVIGLLIIGLLIVLGLGIKGRIAGVLIDSSNRISLANFQLVIWTIVVPASLAGAFFTNLIANTDVLKALDVSIPPELWIAIGISGITFTGAKGLNSMQSAETPKTPPTVAAPLPVAVPLAPPAQPANAAGLAARGKLLVRLAPNEATLGDMFVSDFAPDAMNVDVAKVQMFFFTVILAFAYAGAVANMLIAANQPINALPNLDTGFVTLLGLSQGAYLATKTVKGATT